MIKTLTQRMIKTKLKGWLLGDLLDICVESSLANNL
jgi:hypothetical protein